LDGISLAQSNYSEHKTVETDDFALREKGLSPLDKSANVKERQCFCSSRICKPKIVVVCRGIVEDVVEG
jgi:hypothetical protein